MIIIKPPRIEEIEKAALAEIQGRIADFGVKLKEGTSDANNFMTMSDIEQNWLELKKSTDSVYTDMVNKMLASVDERDIIRKKKENTED